MGDALLERQLLDRAGRRVEDVVDAVAGLNAQTARGPSVGLWSRMSGFRQESLERAAARLPLVKANLMRGTVHLVTADQFRTWRAALQPALRRTVRQFCPRLHLAVDINAVVRKGIELLAAAEGGLTRAELARQLAPCFDADPQECAFAVRLLAPVVQAADPSVGGQARPDTSLPSRSSAALTGPVAEDDEAGLATSALRATCTRSGRRPPPTPLTGPVEPGWARHWPGSRM